MLSNNRMPSDNGINTHATMATRGAPFVSEQRRRVQRGRFVQKKLIYGSMSRKVAIWICRFADITSHCNSSPRSNLKMQRHRTEAIFLLLLGALFSGVRGSNTSEICCSSGGLAEFYAPDEACSIFGWTLVNCTASEPCQYSSCRSSAAARYLGGCYNDTGWAELISAVGGEYSCTSTAVQTNPSVQIILVSISIAMVMVTW